MKATQLIGKLAIRTFHTKYAHGQISRSFMEYPIRILKATDKHIVYEWVNEPEWNNKPNILSYEYCDDNWIDYNELMGIVEPDPIQKILDKLDAYFEQVQCDLYAAIMAA